MALDDLAADRQPYAGPVIFATAMEALERGKDAPGLLFCRLIPFLSFSIA